MIDHFNLTPGRSPAPSTAIAICENIIYPVLKEVWKNYRSNFLLWSHQTLVYNENLSGIPDYILAKRSTLGTVVFDKPYFILVQSSVSLETEASAGAEIPFISKLTAKLIGQIKGSSQQKKVIRETLQRNLSRLQTDINLLLKDAFEKLRRKYPDRYQKGFLVIVDNLDRIPPNVGNHLFFDYAPQLQELDCTIIYTVPISVIYSYKNVSNLFSNPNIVPMVNIYEFNRSECDLNYNQQRLEGIASLIE